MLLDRGAWVDQPSQNGITPLYIASENGHKESCAMLLDRGAWVDQAERDGITPLWHASLNGHKEVCALLLGQHGACVDQADRDGRTRRHCESERPQGGLRAALVARGQIGTTIRQCCTPCESTTCTVRPRRHG